MFCTSSPFAVAWDCHVNRLTASVADWFACVEYLLHPCLVGGGIPTPVGFAGWHQVAFIMMRRYGCLGVAPLLGLCHPHESAG